MTRKAFGTYEIADFCHVTPATVGNWIEKGLMPTFTTGGGHRRVWAEDLSLFMKAHNIPIPDALKSVVSLQILIVDDEVQVRHVVKKILSKQYPAADIQEAGDGFEAGQKTVLATPTLVILDLRLPGIDGFKVCEQIRADPRLKGVKILAISGHEIDAFREKALNAGADDFLAKPFDAKELKDRVAVLLQANGH